MSEIEFIDIFADNVRDLMHRRGMTQKELAYEAGLTEAGISMLLNKRRLPSSKTVANLACTLTCNIDDLIPSYDIIN